MFYKTGIDITNDKQMFNFLKSHYEYPTMNYWNRLSTIANNVKLYNLNLSGDWTKALSFLESSDYETINWMIEDWQQEHKDYEVYANGRSGGYLVLMNKDHNGSVLPDSIVESEDYEEYKRYCKEYFGSVKANRDELVYYTKLVQDFDKLCDEIRDYCDELSNRNFEVDEMQKVVEQFNEYYMSDLELLDFDFLRCDDEGRVDIFEISTLASLYEAFLKLADRSDLGYRIKRDNNIIKYTR